MSIHRIERQQNEARAKTAITVATFAHQVRHVPFGPPANPVNFLIREHGVPSTTEVSIDEPRTLVFLEDLSNGGWEAALIKSTQNSTKAVGFDLQPSGIFKDYDYPTLWVGDYNKIEDGWRPTDVETKDKRFKDGIFKMQSGTGYLGGVISSDIANSFPNSFEGQPFVIELDDGSQQILVHWSNNHGQWNESVLLAGSELAENLISRVNVIASLDQDVLNKLQETVRENHFFHPLPLTERELKFTSKIPDPLEGIVEGATRHERYVNFFNTILSEIWTDDAASGEYGDDLHRSQRFDGGDVSGFTQFGPHNRDLLNLNADEFELAVDKLGPDYVRVRAVPPLILDPNISIIPTGGSCILETAAMRTTAEMKKGIELGLLQPEDLKGFAREVVDIAPTITHISGGVLGGQDGLIHLNESDMWIDSLVKYGMTLPEATERVTMAYQRINEALGRRSKLINPNSTILHINFDELNLNPAIQEWVEAVGDNYDQSKRIQEVIYTYVGPQQLQLLKNALILRINSGLLSTTEESVARQFLDATYQLRIKQVDHGRFKSMDLPKPYIVGERGLTIEEERKMHGDGSTEPDVVYRLGTLLMRDVYLAQQEGRVTALYAGFADLPGYGNQIQHESRDVGMKFTGRPGEDTFQKSVEAQVTTPGRLHRKNVDSHLRYLKTFIADEKVLRESLVGEKSSLLGVVSPTQKETITKKQELATVQAKIAKYETGITLQHSILKLVDFIRTPQGELTGELITTAKLVLQQKEEALQKVKQKNVAGLTPEDAEDLMQIPALITLLEGIENGQPPTIGEIDITTELQDTESNANKSLNSLDQLLQQKRTEELGINTTLATLEKRLEDFAPQLTRIQEITDQLKTVGSQAVFPLSDNPFIHHAMQFLADPDFVQFMVMASRLQSSQRAERAVIDGQLKNLQIELEQQLDSTKNDPTTLKANSERFRAESRKKTDPLIRAKNLIREECSKRMKEFMSLIYPKLETYILYLYGKIDEESAFAVRRSRIFD